MGIGDWGMLATGVAMGIWGVVGRGIVVVDWCCIGSVLIMIKRSRFASVNSRSVSEQSITRGL